jgi:protein-L-isoaspartate(D-aspartate) O-methyltransferase
MRVLDVGGGLGYGAALLAHLGASVMALETAELQGARAQGGATASGAVVHREGNLQDGCPDDAPFDAVWSTEPSSVSPTPLLRQLVDGGRLVCIVADGRGGQATLFVRSGDGVGSRALFDAAAPTLPGFERPAGFVF